MLSTLGTHEAVTRLTSCRRANNVQATYVYAACTHYISGNVLIGSDDGELVLIDFEYAAYNYRYVFIDVWSCVSNLSLYKPGLGLVYDGQFGTQP